MIVILVNIRTEVWYRNGAAFILRRSWMNNSPKRKDHMT